MQPEINAWLGVYVDIYAKQSAAGKQRTGPNEQGRAFGKVPEETTHTCPWATNKTTHSSCLPYAQNNISPDLSESQLRWVGDMKLVTK